MRRFDTIIIGSGLSGIHAACPLVEAGYAVAMLDVGEDDSRVLEAGSAMTFAEHRRLDPTQQRIFLGEDLSGIGAFEQDAGHAGTMTSGRRSYVVRSAPELLPTKSSDAVITESLARGGLSEAWGAVCGFLDEEECAVVGIPAEEMPEHYQAVIERIGVSGPKFRFDLQPPVKLDDNHMELLRRYARKKNHLRTQGYTLTQPALALLSRDKGARRATDYRDMDFWDNIGRSVYRGHYTLEGLERQPNFSYIPRRLVSHVAATASGVRITAEDVDTGNALIYEARGVVLAAGSVNTTRILLASFGRYDEPVPIILKNNYLVPSVLLARLGRAPDPQHHSLCQLVLESAKRRSGMMSAYVQLYSYGALLLHKLLRYVPLPVPHALQALALLVPSIVLADIRFPSVASPARYLTLRKGSARDFVEIVHPSLPSGDRAEVRNIKRALRSLGLLPLRTIESPYGATSHYAGGIPSSATPLLGVLSVDLKGKLRGAEGIFVADTASWHALPAKPPGLTVMANANRIGVHMRDYLKH